MPNSGNEWVERMPGDIARVFRAEETNNRRSPMAGKVSTMCDNSLDYFAVLVEHQGFRDLAYANDLTAVQRARNY